MAKRDIDPAASNVTIRTRAKGLLSRLAHDLEIVATDLSGSVSLNGDAWQAELRFGVGGLHVVGAVKGGRVDASVLSLSDKQDIERRMGEALSGTQVKVEAEGTSREGARVTVICPEGRQRLDAKLKTGEGDEGRIDVDGALRLSLKSLGVREVKAPLGVFKLDDAVEVTFRFVVKAEG